MGKHRGIALAIGLVALTALLLALFIPANVKHVRSPKTLLIGVDGVQLKHYENVPSNNLHRLHYNVAYTGGISAGISQQSTSSGPGWTTLLTGVWANKHKVTSNDTQLRVDPAFPSVFKRLRLALPGAHLASIVHWAPINTAFLQEEMAAVDVVQTFSSDQQVTARALQIIDSSAADFTFIQLDEPDQVGHEHGFGTAYDEALRVADRRIGQLLDHVEARSQRSPAEDWLVLISTDHGRDLSGRGHGQQSEQEKTIFIASNKPLNAELSDPSVPPDNPGPNQLYGYAAQTAVAPTILRHMGTTLLGAWKLDGTPLLGATGVRKARASEATSRLLWNSQSGGPVLIEKNGNAVAEVHAQLQQWLDPEGMSGGDDYTLTLDGTPAAVRAASQ